MPMFKALQKCPDAVVIRPNMKKYVAVSKAVKALMLQTTPLVQSISIDEAYLDLSSSLNMLRQLKLIVLKGLFAA